MSKEKFFKLLFLIIISSIFVFLAMMLFSYLFPKKNLGTSSIRLPIQKSIMKSVGDQVLDNDLFYLFTDGHEIVDQKNNISLDDLLFFKSNFKSGDIFFTSSGKYLSSVFIPGKWKHAAIYLGSSEQLANLLGYDSDLYKMILPYYQNSSDILLLDSSSDGVKIRNIQEISNLSDLSYLKSITFFRINKNKEDIYIFLKKSLQQLGKDYDYDIDTDNQDYIYCSELIYHSLKELGLVINKGLPFLSRDLISPNDALYYILRESIDNNNFIFILFLEKKNGELQELSKQDLISEFFSN